MVLVAVGPVLEAVVVDADGIVVVAIGGSVKSSTTEYLEISIVKINFYNSKTISRVASKRSFYLF